MDLFHPIGTKKPSIHGPLDELHAYAKLRHHYQERAAMLATCILLPLVLGTILNWRW